MRGIIRTTLILALGALAATAAITAWLFLGPQEGPTWTTIAAALAVTAWNTKRVLELQEDTQQPHPYPWIDVASRYKFMQLRVTNYGGSVTRDISLERDKPLLDAQGRRVQFTEQEKAPGIAVLLPDQSVAAPIGTDIEMYGKYKDIYYSGTIKFKYAAGKALKYPFYLSAEQYRHTLAYEEEGLKTHFQLQKIPKELEKLNREVKRFRAPSIAKERTLTLKHILQHQTSRRVNP